ncbi:hypothetical protein F5Y13DRAFT_99042 [Hypoxylon sp. FL1857]|nr:hypothetical protein F5Y13DRAFT_99042 [Hypoxylon sp. FL1857]
MQKLHIEDFIAFAAYGLSLGFVYCLYRLITDAGLFVHQWNIRLKTFNGTYIYLIYVGTILYCVIVMLYKAAILLELIRIFAPRGTRGYFFWTCQSLLWINVCFYVAVIVAGNVPSTSSKLAERRLSVALNVSSAALNLVSHLLLLLLAQSVIWRLQLETKKKIGLAFIFAFGIIACIAASFRLAASIQFLHLEDVTYAYGAIILWSCTEITCGALIFCMPSVPKAFKDSTRSVKALSKFLPWSRLSINKGIHGNSTIKRDTSLSRSIFEGKYQPINGDTRPTRELDFEKGRSWELSNPEELEDLRRPQVATVRITKDFSIDEDVGGGIMPKSQVTRDKHYS